LAVTASLNLVCGEATTKAQQLVSSGLANFDFTLVKPESVGFSSERLEHLHALMQQVVDEKQLSGAVTILARHGKVIDYRAYGQRDWATAAPMTKDSIFRDYSMTKPVIAVAMMILYKISVLLPVKIPGSLRRMEGPSSPVEVQCDSSGRHRTFRTYAEFCTS
jgi:CubicO group peptidase (beta-lactamase class C family)